MKALGPALLLCIASAVAHAGPASPEPVKITQPDGTSFLAVTRGDERQGWVETLDGYTVLKNTETKFFEYAIPGPRGLLPSGVAAPRSVHDIAPEKRPPKGLRPPRIDPRKDAPGKDEK